MIDNEANGPMEQKTLAEIPKEPYPLLAQFQWCDTDVDDPATVRP